MDWLKNPRYGGVFWLLLRLWLGSIWLSAGLGKVMGEKSEVWVGSKAGVAVGGFLKKALAKAQYDPATNPNPEVAQWYASFIEGFALPNAALFSYLVAYGEVLVGAALLLGAVTHFATLMGIVMNLSYLLAGVSSQNPQMLVASMLLLLISGKAAGFYGLDYLVYPQLTRYRPLLPGRQQRRLTPETRVASTQR